MMLQNKYFVPRLAFAFALLLSGCIPGNRFSEIQKLVFPTQCKNACWMGIEPRVSTVQEALDILEKNYGSKNIIHDEASEMIRWDANTASWHDSGTILYRNNVVNSILIFFTKDYVEVKDIISELGNPDSVGLVVASGPDTKCAGGILLYPQAGLQTYLAFDPSVRVSETQIINALGIYAPWTSDNPPWTDTETVSWDGYHGYCPEKWSW